MGRASAKNFIVGMIRVHSGHFCFKWLTLGHPSRKGSFVFVADQVSEGAVVSKTSHVIKSINAVVPKTSRVIRSMI